MEYVTRKEFSDSLWEKTKEEMRQILIDCAKRGKPITYYELRLATKSADVKHHESPAMKELLFEIARSEEKAGRGILTVLVVRKDEMKPGSGFYEIAEELGRDISDKTKLWISETNKIIEHWKSQN